MAKTGGQLSQRPSPPPRTFPPPLTPPGAAPGWDQPEWGGAWPGEGSLLEGPPGMGGAGSQPQAAEKSAQGR